MRTAILIDGGFFVKRFRAIEPHNSLNAERAADLAWRWAFMHLTEGKKKHELYRIFFYDCPPLATSLYNPLTKKNINFGRSDEALFRTELHKRLRARRKVALRLGHLSQMVSWAIKPQPLDQLLKGKKKLEDLVEADLTPNVRQKGVDMRIGIDISSLALKKQVDQIVLFSGDADFVPAAKLARREGIDFVLDPLWQGVPDSLSEHIDGLRSVCPKPPSASAIPSPAATALVAVAAAANPASIGDLAPSRE